MEVDEELPRNSVNNIFGYRKIVWKIANYPVATCGDDWLIYSPEFCVYSPFLTKWRLYIKPDKTKSEDVYMYLQRLEYSPFPGKVRVNWTLCYPRMLNTYITLEKTESFEPPETAFGILLPRIFNLEFNMLRTSDCPDLIVQCHLIVYIAGDDRLLEVHRNEGLKSLSQDLSILGILGERVDTELYYGSGDTIWVHRAILGCRNQVFRELFRQEGTLVSLNYPYMNAAEPLISVIRFLYTGNLKYVMRPPSLSIGRAAEYFNVEDVKRYYTCEELAIETTIFPRETQFEWTVLNLDEITKSCILSHRMKGLEKNENFRLALCPKIMDGKEYISFRVKFNEGVQLKPICIHFGILDIHKNIQHKKCSVGDGKSITLDCLVPRKVLKESLLITRGKMTLVCRLHRCFSFPDTQVTEEHPEMEAVDISTPFENLSRDMNSLMETRESSDCTIKSGGLPLRLHKAILSCRSYALRILFLGERKNVYISGIEPYILLIILRYVYSGVLRVCSSENTLMVYDQARRLGIQALRNACSRHLRENFENNNVVSILIAAHRNKDWKLKLDALRFIYSNAAEIKMLDSWRTLINEHPCLYRDFAEFHYEDEADFKIDIRPMHE